MADNARSADGPTRTADELARVEAEPLLPVEKKLIAWSLILGILLLGVLLWISNEFFPAG
jgi:hypothetical protein